MACADGDLKFLSAAAQQLQHVEKLDLGQVSVGAKPSAACTALKRMQCFMYVAAATGHCCSHKPVIYRRCPWMGTSSEAAADSSSSWQATEQGSTAVCDILAAVLAADASARAAVVRDGSRDAAAQRVRRPPATRGAAFRPERRVRSAVSKLLQGAAAACTCRQQPFSSLGAQAPAAAGTVCCGVG